MKGKGYLVILAVIIALLSSGCAAFRSGNFQPISQWPPENAVKGKSICIMVSGEGIVNGKEQEVNSKFIEAWRKQTVKAYKDSGLFSAVKTGLPDPDDLRAEIKIMDRGEGNIGLAFLSGLTLLVIPCNSTDEIIIKTTLKNKDGDTLSVYEKSDAVTV
jgi:hypothetical protein